MAPIVHNEKVDCVPDSAATGDSAMQDRHISCHRALMEAPIAAHVLEEIVYDRMRANVNLCQLVIIEEELRSTIGRVHRDGDGGKHPTDEAGDSQKQDLRSSEETQHHRRQRDGDLASMYVERIWRRIEQDWRRLRADVQHLNDLPAADPDPLE